MNNIRIAAAQTVEFREDMDGALRCLAEVTARAEAQKVELLCFPECFLQGYLLDNAGALRNAVDLSSSNFKETLERFPKNGPIIVVGLIEIEGQRLFNTAIVVNQGALVGRYRKTHLLEGEKKVFAAGDESVAFEAGCLRFGINICYDTNFSSAAKNAAELGASLIVCPANNMLPRKTAETFKDIHNAVRGERCRETGCWLVSADVVGQRAGCVSWGPTAVLDPRGIVVAQLPLEEPGLLVYDLPCR